MSLLFSAKPGHLKSITMALLLFLFWALVPLYPETDSNSQDVKVGLAPIEISKDNSLYYISPTIKFYRDSSRRLTYDEISGQPYQNQFKSYAFDPPTFSSTDDIIWGKFNLHIKDNKQQRYFFLEFYPIYRFDLFIKNPNGEVKQITAGRSLSFSAQPTSTRNIIIPYNFKEGTSTIHIRVEHSSDTFFIPLYLSDAIGLSRLNEKNISQISLYSAIVLTFFLINLIIFFVIKEKAYLYYSAFNFFNFSIYIGLYGYPYYWLDQIGIKAAYRSSDVFSHLTVISSILFSIEFLKMNIRTPLLARGYYAVCLALLLNIFFAVNKVIYSQLFFYIVLMVSATVLLLYSLRYIRRDPYCTFYAVAWGIHLSVIILYTLGVIGIVETGIRTAELMLANTIELFILSFALGHKFTQIIREKNDMEQKIQQSQKIEEIGQMAGGIAHDFNNILTVIIGYAEITMGKLKTGSLLRPYIEKIFSASQDAANIVNQILTFSRRSEVNKVQINPGKVLNETLVLIKSYCGDSIKINNNISIEQFQIMADETQFKQVIMNTCNNAIQAMQDKGGELTINLNRKIIKSNTFVPAGIKSGSYIMLTISDTGCGMKTATTEQIFNPYFTTKKEGHGTGLGLSVVHGIIKSHGGYIHVTSVYGKGTTFEILFPEASGQAIAKTKPIFEGRGNGERILLIDDRQDIVAVSKQKLIDYGYQVDGICNSITAIETLNKNPSNYDLVITDYNMPALTGIELSAEIKKIRSDLPIILITGNIKSFNTRHAFNSGVREIVSKPFTIEYLSHVIRRTLDQNNSRS